MDTLLTPLVVEKNKKHVAFKLAIQKLRDMLPVPSAMESAQQSLKPYVEKAIRDTKYLKPSKMAKFDKSNKRHLDKVLDNLIIYMLNRQYFFSSYSDVYDFPKMLNKSNLKRYAKIIAAANFLKELEMTDF